MVTLLSIAFGLLIATLSCASFYWFVVREPERLRWASEVRRAERNARMWQRLALKTLDRWEMLQGYPPMEDELQTIDRTEEPAEDNEPASLLRLPDDELAERIREMNDPRSGMNLQERRRLARESKRRERVRQFDTRIVIPPEQDEGRISGPVNELDMSQIAHLRS